MVLVMVIFVSKKFVVVCILCVCLIIVMNRIFLGMFVNIMMV